MVGQRFPGGLVFKAHRLVYHSTLGWIVIKKKRSMVAIGFDVLVVVLQGSMVGGHGGFDP